jgi:hypothetical protein
MLFLPAATSQCQLVGGFVEHAAVERNIDRVATIGVLVDGQGVFLWTANEFSHRRQSNSITNAFLAPSEEVLICFARPY